MIFSYREKGIYPSNLSPETLKTIVSNKKFFTVDNDNMVRKVEDNVWVLYIPATQRIKTILSYHKDLGHVAPSYIFLPNDLGILTFEDGSTD